MFVQLIRCQNWLHGNFGQARGMIVNVIVKEERESERQAKEGAASLRL